MNSDGNVIIQFVNHNAHDSASIIGGIRVKVTDPSRIPAYLDKNDGAIRAHAIANLHRHLRETQCPVGLGETITADDFSMSYMVASLSARGATLHPYRRNEGPLFYCLFEQLIEELPLQYVDMDEDVSPRAIFINAYIHLTDQPRRRSAILKKKNAMTAQSDEVQEIPQINPSQRPDRRPRPFLTQLTTTSRRAPYRMANPNDERLQQLDQKLDTIASEMRQNAIRLPFPKLPEPSPQVPIWPTTDSLPPLPDDE